VSDFHAFANDDEVLNIEGDALTVSNGVAHIAIAGALKIGKDKRGMKAARALKAALDEIVAALEREKELPDEIQDDPPEATGTAKNPFA
jgi:hypothetical protein